MRGLFRARTAESDSSEVADTVLALAVLLQSGLTPDRAWVHVAESNTVSGGAARRVVAGVRAGRSLSEAIRDARGTGAGTADAGGRAPGWTELAQAWQIATEVGAPLADCLRGLAEALRDIQSTRDEVRVALAEPAGTARLMSWLPAVAVLLGVALGFDSLAVVVSSPVGWACLLGGLALMFAAVRWTRALVRRAQQGDEVPGIHADLVAIALSGGTSIDRAVRLVSEVVPVADPATDAALDLSRRAGVPAIELLRSSARLSRHRARVDGRMRAAALSSRLLIPLGVCTLPAFLLLGVAPMVLSVFTTGVISI